MAEPRTLSVVFAANSDPGRDPDKQVNEDAFGFMPLGGSFIAVVCDGMGGHEGGSLASRTAVEAILQAAATSDPQRPTRERFASAVVRASAAVHRIGGDAPTEARPGATCVALWLHASTLDVAHVGDSRCYRWRQGRLEALTRDHSVIEAWIDAGQMTREQAHLHPDAHRITRALGMAPQVDVELRPTEPLQAGDKFLLCSDGLTDLVGDVDLAGMLGQSVPLQRLADDLVALANQRGGHDNVTAVLLELVEATADRAGADTYPLTTAAVASSATEHFAPPAGLDRTQVIGSVDRTIVMQEHPDARQPGRLPASQTQPWIAVDVPPAQPVRDLPVTSTHPSPESNSRRWLVILAVVVMLIGLAFAIGLLRR